MSGNTDVLMGYFDSLLTTLEEDPRKTIVSDLLAGAAAQVPDDDYTPVATDRSMVVRLTGSLRCSY